MVLAILSTQTNVKIWDGPCKVEIHKYLRDDVCKVESVSEPSIVGDGVKTVEEFHGSAAVALPIAAPEAFDVSAVFDTF